MKTRYKSLHEPVRNLIQTSKKALEKYLQQTIKTNM